MVPFSPAQQDALPNLTVSILSGTSDALLCLGLFLLLDLMIEAKLLPDNGCFLVCVSELSVCSEVVV